MSEKKAKATVKPKAKAAAPKTKTKAEAAEAPAREFKYGVPELAEALGIKDASVRVALRKSEIERAGKTYGWNTKSEFDSVVKRLKQPEAEAA